MLVTGAVARSFFFTTPAPSVCLDIRGRVRPIANFSQNVLAPARRQRASLSPVLPTGESATVESIGRPFPAPQLDVTGHRPVRREDRSGPWGRLSRPQHLPIKRWHKSARPIAAKWQAVPACIAARDRREVGSRLHRQKGLTHAGGASSTEAAGPPRAPGRGHARSQPPPPPCRAPVPRARAAQPCRSESPGSHG